MENKISRIDWVDYAKGICIILVVMMHSTLGVEKAAGELSSLNGFIEWARPFRMPDFFLLSGLFLAARINHPWRSYLDTKVIHFAYFYFLWITIQILTKEMNYSQPGLVQAFFGNLASRLIQPSSTLWFIYALLIFFIVAKLIKPIPNWIVFVAACGLEVLSHTGLIHTGYLLIDEFAARFVYFFAGYWLAPKIFDFAEIAGKFDSRIICVGLLVWGLVNYFAVSSGIAYLPLFSLIFGFLGAGAVIAVGVLLSKFNWSRAIRYLGANSIVIYLAFFLFMGLVRIIALRFMPGINLALLSLITTTISVIGPIIMFWVVRRTPLRFLFARPKWARIK